MRTTTNLLASGLSQVKHALGIPCGCGQHTEPVIGRSVPGGGSYRVYGSAPSQTRLEGNDLQTYLQPMPADYTEFLTFFTGNQLPGFFQSPNLAMGAVMGLHVESPQRDIGSFGPQLGQLNYQRVLGRWRQYWATASSQG